MSTFSGLNGALSALVAHRQAIEVSGQNVANVNTPGYTRQRATLQPLEGAAPASLYSAPGAVLNGGVSVVSVDRLGDVFLEARTRQETSSAANLDAVSEVWSLLESSIDEPGETGLSAQLDTFFTSWQDVANRPDDRAARAVLLENATALVDRIAGGYRAVESQWEGARAQAGALGAEVNTTADAVADLNARIRSITVSGGNPNALIDQRGELVTKLASLVGGEGRLREDGTMDVMVAGNALVRGDTANHVRVDGAASVQGMLDTPGSTLPAEGSPRLVWDGSGNAVGASGGRLAGMLSSLAPANGGAGGPLAEMAASYDTLAGTLATQVNQVHGSGRTLSGASGGAFFGSGGSAATALNLTVAVTNPDDVAAAAGSAGAGAYDGSVADKISQLASTVGGVWSEKVVDLGVKTRTAGQRAANAEATRATAEGLLLSKTGVDLDEESMQLLVSQRAYEAAARVMTTIDQVLDTLINRTGVVGR
jgi:flagellar hook-associated protein 1 FlgK